LKAVRYATQVVAGLNYFIKAHIGNKQFIHVRIYKNLPCNGGTATVHAIQKDKFEHDPVGFF
jgi:cystatin-A/B